MIGHLDLHNYSNGIILNTSLHGILTVLLTIGFEYIVVFDAGQLARPVRITKDILDIKIR